MLLLPSWSLNVKTSSKNSISHEAVGRSSTLVDYGHPSWISSCRAIYLDVGSNVGVQIRKFFEPQKYPKATMLPYFDRSFGVASNRTMASNQTGICALGLEPARQHQERLQQIQAAYLSKGWNVQFYPYAAWKQEDTKLFWVDPSGESKSQQGWNSMLANDLDESHEHQYSVRTVNLSDFIESLPVQSVKLMKMDIEGSEYETLACMIKTNTLCEIPEVMIEAHSWGTNLDEWNGPTTYEEISKRINELPCESRAQVSNLDDESYVQDVDDAFGV
jgi:FkbM family methyltransferase